MSNPQATPLIIAKTRLPPRRTELLRRPRLLDHVYAHVEKQLFVITAPAGYGKTTVLLDFAHEADFPVAWYALDEFDNSPHTFVQYLVAAVRVNFPAFGVQTLAALERASGSLESLQPVVALLANDLYTLPDHLTIILDDYHVIRNERIHQLLALLLKHAAENAHLFIGSRTLPRIPDQILLVARGQMSGFSINELKFTPAEIQQLVQQNHGLSVSEQRAFELSEISDGWITALLLMGYQAGWRELIEGAISAPAASGRVYDYLAEQVFASRPQALQRFLLGSSVLEPLVPDLLDQLPGLSDSRTHLQALLEQQLFTARLGGDAEAYTYHPLFREFLKTRLRQDSPQWFEQLLLASARLYESERQWERVVEAYLTLGRTAEAAHALEMAEESLRSLPQVANLVPWMDALPQALTDLRPHLISLRAKQHFFRGELEQSLAQFEQAASMFSGEGDAISAADKRIWKAFALQGLGRYQQILDESREVEQMLAERPEQVWLHTANLINRGQAEFRLGNPASAYDTLKAAQRLADQTEHWVHRANCAQSLGLIERARGRLSEALEQFAAALHVWERLENPNAAAGALNSIGNIYYLKGEYQEAEQILSDALKRARNTRQLRSEALTLATLGDVRLDMGDYPAALERYGDALRVAAEAHYNFVLLYGRLGTANTYRLLGDMGRAQDWLRSAQESAKLSGSLADQMQVTLHAGLLLLDQGQVAEALAQLQAAASYFNQTSDYQQEALAEFHIAHCLNMLGRADESVPQLARTAELVELLGYDQFLVVAGRRTTMTLSMAGELPGIGGRYQQIVRRVIRHMPLITTTPDAGTAAPPAHALSAYALGQEKFVRAGAEVVGLRPQARALFWLLLLRYPQGARKEELWDLFWPGHSAEHADGALRISITRIRKALCTVTFANGWYVLDAESAYYDVREFERALAEAQRATSVEARIAALQQAADLYLGDYLTSVDADWVSLERERLRNAYLTCLIELGQAYNEAGDGPAALRAYDKATALEPFFESAWKAGMQTYLRMGNRAAALAHYQKLATLLRKDLRVKPSTDLQRLYERISQNR